MDRGGVDVETPVTAMIVEGPRVGDDERRVAFTALYRREVEGQVRRAALLTGSAETAHDVVHDAFVELYRRWDDVREPGPYLSRAVLNRCRDQARREATARRKLPLLLPDPQPGDEHLWDALQALPFTHRAAVVLRYYHQLPHEEIADLLGCRPGTVGPWIQRGLRTLRKALS
jgi:RNA polymerase sigma factor (sigma-70 family)